MSELHIDELRDACTKWRALHAAGNIEEEAVTLKTVQDLSLPLLRAIAGQYKYDAWGTDRSLLIDMAYHQVGKWLASWNGKQSPFSLFSVCATCFMLGKLATGRWNSKQPNLSNTSGLQT
jgi:hypothetical protein